ncbi:Lactoylglutathione lyase [Hahella chejuensis KCTC 2396]|uniref:Lactoylglutathione lyase n=1 Tax=Hahella chejuensis (strain KCTC 2396) TaxID=349521 RepID=Q2SMR0_HAHCH|nr:VOC family protein [Hahella chejuensis]ABC28064.1 Lactoylglutathione lyase [Hahella chejuensis KCTC 2396]
MTSASVNRVTPMYINHVLIRSKDLTAMTTFLVEVIGLRNGDRPGFRFPGAWLYSDDRPIVHLVGADASDEEQAAYLGDNALEGRGAIDHVALAGADYEQLLTRLRHHGATYNERTVPASREHQVFVEGPEGLKLELLFAEDKTPYPS